MVVIWLRLWLCHDDMMRLYDPLHHRYIKIARSRLRLCIYIKVETGYDWGSSYACRDCNFCDNSYWNWEETMVMILLYFTMIIIEDSRGIWSPFSHKKFHRNPRLCVTMLARNFKNLMWKFHSPYHWDTLPYYAIEVSEWSGVMSSCHYSNCVFIGCSPYMQADMNLVNRCILLLSRRVIYILWSRLDYLSHCFASSLLLWRMVLVLEGYLTLGWCIFILRKSSFTWL